MYVCMHVAPHAHICIMDVDIDKNHLAAHRIWAYVRNTLAFFQMYAQGLLFWMFKGGFRVSVLLPLNVKGAVMCESR